MSGPPEGVTPDELLVRLLEMPRPSKTVDFPRKGPDGEAMGKVAIWVLKQGEIILAQTLAEKKVQSLLKEKVLREQASRGYDEAYQNALASEILALALRQSANTNLPFFPRGSADVNAVLSQDEMAVLMEQYTTWQAESGPIVGFMSAEEMEAWIQRLAEGGGSAMLPFCSPETLRALLMFSVSRSFPSATVST